MSDLQKKADEKREILIGFNTDLQNLCNVNDDFHIRVNSNYDDVRIVIQHKTLQWTDSANITIADNGSDTFTYSGGGFNDCSTIEKLKVTKDTVSIIETLLGKSSEIRAVRKLRNVAEKEYRKLADEISTLEVERVRKNAETELLKTHRLITVDEILEEINKHHQVKITTLSVATYDNNKVNYYNSLVENRGNGRANYYYQDTHYSKENLISTLSNTTKYTPLHIAD
jgi:hypothetical protein